VHYLSGGHEKRGQGSRGKGRGSVRIIRVVSKNHRALINWESLKLQYGTKKEGRLEWGAGEAGMKVRKMKVYSKRGHKTESVTLYV